MNHIRAKLIWCVVGNALTVALVMLPVVMLSDESNKYFKFGPSDDLIMISIRIDSRARYYALLGFIAVLNVIKVVSQEIGMPILGFNIYNPDKKLITDFSKNELQFFGNLMYLLSGVRQLFSIMITISQFDVALFSLLVSEATTLYTIRKLLNEKTFVPDGYEVPLDEITVDK